MYLIFWAQIVYIKMWCTLFFEKLIVCVLLLIHPFHLQKYSFVDEMEWNITWLPQHTPQHGINVEMR